ncbi:serine protease gd-like [Chironomus tepperi]|uniref:serine protease gd-like n=1 Tax=Chironomus tepperi TaxID=113505 RepID=UPI00391F90C5
MINNSNLKHRVVSRNWQLGQSLVVVKSIKDHFLGLLHCLKTEKDFFCGAILISKTKVLTAAHCIENKLTNSKLRPQEILVLVGVHDLNIPHEVGKVSFAVKNITVHPDWHPLIQSYDADIAILELDGEVHFTNYIQPICLAAPESSAASITLGLVVGFGSEIVDFENIARKVNMPIHSYKDCAESRDHESLVSHRTICGGYANGTGVCRGDSGSGLIVKSNGIYYLRGIVSSSLRGGEYECNVHAYSVFTDVTKFYDWILTGDSTTNRNMHDEIKRLKETLQLIIKVKLLQILI